MNSEHITNLMFLWKVFIVTLAKYVEMHFTSKSVKNSAFLSVFYLIDPLFFYWIK